MLLSDFLRHDLLLAGTHVGCEHGVCGACTVIFDGAAVRSCLMFAAQADGHAIMTVEGLAPDRDHLHPLQEAMRDCHGLQCGYCTPGILMTMKAFLDETPAPDEAQIREALSGNLCRCTGYQHIVEAVHAGRRAAAEVIAMATRNFGAPITRNEDARLLSGQALFVDDVELPGMLYAAFLRSNVAHARIRSIDVAAARARAGVVAVYTAEDLGAYWAPGPLLVPPPPIAGHHLQSAHAGAARQGQGAPRRRAAGRRAWRRAAISPRTRSPTSPSSSIRCRPSSIWKRRSTDTSARVHDDVRGNVAAHVRQSRGNYAAARARAEHVIAAASTTITAPPRRSRRAASSPIGTRAPISSRCGTRRRRRCSCATGLPGCSA